MGYLYGGQIKLDLSIDFTNSAPLDVRVAVPTEADLSKIENPYVGLLTYVSDIKRVFVCETVIPTVTWNKLAADSGIPIYTLEMYDALDTKPEQYINIPSDKDLEGSVTDKTYVTSVNGTYIDVLFRSLRALLNEVAKLKNSFIYGINSYTGTDTALSAIQESYGANIEEEPLWAIEPEGLTEVIELAELSLLEPNDNVYIDNVDTTFNIKNTSSLTKLNEIAPKDTKIISYITCNNLGVIIHFSDEFDLDLSTIGIPYADEYHIMVLLSRTIEEKGDNYLWISVDNNKTDLKLLEGYYNETTKKIVNDKTLLSNAYNYESVDFTDIVISKFIIYSKYQDFSDSVIASKPSELDYKYRTAHITIRSVQNYATLNKIKKQIQNNELIMVEETDASGKSGLYIKSRDQIISVGGAGNNNSQSGQMTQEELISELINIGIVYSEDGKSLLMNNISDLTFIHSETGKIFNINIDAYGNIVSNQTNAIPTLEERIILSTDKDSISLDKENNTTYKKKYTRGFVGLLGLDEYKKQINGAKAADSDIGLYADRVKIGAFYAPLRDKKVFGCSHGYIELENTGYTDFNLNGCYLHYAHPMSIGSSAYTVDHLALTGVIPAGGTYLIRCKLYANFNDANTFIKVETFDQEWYITNGTKKELIDLSFTLGEGHGFCLTYGEPNLAYNTLLCYKNDGTSYPADTTNNYLYLPCYIDGVYFSNLIQSSDNEPYWCSDKNPMNLVVNTELYDNDVIFKNSFELDPAKLAFLGLNAKDSSRLRTANVADFYYIPLEKEFIEFPKSDEIYPVSMFTPKASFEHKNVSTDKSKLDVDKPNMVTCAFGIDHTKTRCFNWVSVGLFDEYIWIYEDSIDNAIRMESYKELPDKILVTEEESVIDPSTNKSTIQKVIKEYEPTEELCGIEGDATKMMRKFYSKELNNPIYARITSRFPGANTQYTIHKCVVNFATAYAGTTKKVYKYVVGRADKNGKPDPLHISDEYTFTMYPSSWRPRIYQTSDLQGFHWVEYQVWNATAKLIEEQIENDYTTLSNKNFIPVLLNTGDMTQSGARINEWLDYYNAGKNLFKKYELINVVGNNDLCDIDPTILGTGDDTGKSNSHYFHLFYCYEVDESIPPLLNGKYVPSLYYLDFTNCRLVLINSELTLKASQYWYGLVQNGCPVNPYTGWIVPTTVKDTRDEFNTYNYYQDTNFVSVYTMIYKMMNTSKEIITACHEMPFTVITDENLLTDTSGVSRSLSGRSLVGSHLNQMSADDTMSTYWFSRLLEAKGSKLCLGGHKHTYAVTYPLRENYTYGANGEKSSSVDGPMKMEETLINDTASFIKDTTTDTSKLPLMTQETNKPGSASKFLPYTKVNAFKGNANNGNKTNGVIYFMCQSSGFKLFSNKELPSPSLAFSQYIPQSTVNGTSYKASSEQRSPMYAIIDTNINNKISVILLKLNNIQKAPTKLLTPLNYGTKAVELFYLGASTKEAYKDYGEWYSVKSTEVNSKPALLTI